MKAVAEFIRKSPHSTLILLSFRKCENPVAMTTEGDTLPKVVTNTITIPSGRAGITQHRQDSSNAQTEGQNRCNHSSSEIYGRANLDCYGFGFSGGSNCSWPSTNIALKARLNVVK